MSTLYLEGFLLGMGLFAAPGPKDTLVIRQGVGGAPLLSLVSVCVLADVALIGLGVVGVGAMLTSHPGVVSLLVLAGAVYLLWFGWQRLRACVRNESMPNTSDGLASQRQVLRAALAVGFANPYAWLDTVVLIGSIGGAKPAGQQLSFAIGAMAASLVWFIALAVGSARCAWLFRSAPAWRALDAGIALLMVGLAGHLILDVVRHAGG